jgi:hypothetical protein
LVEPAQSHCSFPIQFNRSSVFIAGYLRAIKSQPGMERYHTSRLGFCTGGSKHNADIGALALEIGISVKHLVNTYQSMIDHGEDGVNRWSYYDEYLKSKKIRGAREKMARTRLLSE